MESPGTKGDLAYRRLRDRILAGDTSLPKGQATRVAAWLIRAALELSVSDLLRGTIDNPELLVYRIVPEQVRFMREWALDYHDVPLASSRA